MSAFIQPYSGKIKQEKVLVYCPNCDGVVEGEEESCENFPFASYYAYCKPCDYPITESEWNEVENNGK